MFAVFAALGWGTGLVATLIYKAIRQPSCVELAQ
jgi:hypothetical protein